MTLSLNQLLTDLTEAAGRAPEVAFQDDTESDKFYSLASPQNILRIGEALRVAREALEYYASGKIDLHPRQEKKHLYEGEVKMWDKKWIQRSMSDYESGLIARLALTKMEEG